MQSLLSTDCSVASYHTELIYRSLYLEHTHVSSRETVLLHQLFPLVSRIYSESANSARPAFELR